MGDIIKDLEMNLENASQVNQIKESLLEKIEELDEQRNLEKNVLGGLSIIKGCDIKLRTLVTNEFQELGSIFGEKVKQSPAWVIKVYTNNVQDMHRISNGER